MVAAGQPRPRRRSGHPGLAPRASRPTRALHLDHPPDTSHRRADRPRTSQTPTVLIPPLRSRQPNQCWQSDFTHWQLADGTDTEILNWLDDHSRYLLGCTAHHRVTGDIVARNFLITADQHGLPASTLTDNGSVYTSRFTGGKNALEYLLATLGIEQKNGHPGHPQTQGKIERFHQTLKRWLAHQPPAPKLADLQHQFDHFREIYNEQRPHRGLHRSSPGQAYRALPKAEPPPTGEPGHYRLRYDRLDHLGKMTFRRAGRLHHLGVGANHARTRVLAIADDTSITVIDIETGEILSTHHIEPNKTYWRNQQKSPGRWPGQS